MSTATYVNPFSGARVTPSRVDQGVDYGVSGPIRAVGDARVEAIKHYQGFGTYLVYRLLNGPHAGHRVFVSEGIQPIVKPGDTVKAGDVIAHGVGGIETGWAQAGPTFLPLAKVTGGYSEGQRTAAGDAFNSFMRSLGVVAGTTSGRRTVGHVPSSYTDAFAGVGGGSGAAATRNPSVGEVLTQPLGDTLGVGTDPIPGPGDVASKAAQATANAILSTLWDLIGPEVSRVLVYVVLLGGGVALAFTGVRRTLGDTKEST